MTEHNPYPAQVADFITAAMDNLGAALAVENRECMGEYLARSTAKLAAAQAIATLAHAHETRTLALVTLAGLDPVKVEQSGQLPQEAYTAAAVALGLVEDDADSAATIEDLIDAGLLEEVHPHGDPADADLGDLK